jgi:hypothetical protein
MPEPGLLPPHSRSKADAQTNTKVQRLTTEHLLLRQPDPLNCTPAANLPPDSTLRPTKHSSVMTNIVAAQPAAAVREAGTA